MSASSWREIHLGAVCSANPARQALSVSHSQLLAEAQKLINLLLILSACRRLCMEAVIPPKFNRLVVG